MHAESLHLKDKMISGKYIPDKYFKIQQPGSVKVNCLYVSPVNPDKILIGTNRGIFRSFDSGKNWIEANQGLFNLDVSVIKADALDSRILYAGTKNGIFKSTNEGKSWDEWFEETSGLEHTDIADLVIDPVNDKKLYAAAKDDIFLSKDGGESWEEIFEETSAKDGGYISSLHIFSEDSSIIYAGTRSGLIKTNDGGQNWEKIQEKLLNRPITSLFFLTSNPHHILIGTYSGLIQSFNKGKTWNASLQDKSIHAIASYSEDDKENIIIATPEELFKSRDNGQTWENITKSNSMNIIINTVNFMGPVKKKLLVGTNNGLFSIDEENNWEYINMNHAKDKKTPGSMKMSLLKLVTEIHTGRFFGNYFYMIFDIASFSLIIISVTGVCIFFIKSRVWKRKKEQFEKLDKVDLIMDSFVDLITDYNEKSVEISRHSGSIHDLAEHIKKHVLACKKLSKNGNHKELKEIEHHIDSIDEKLHHLMNHVEDLSVK